MRANGYRWERRTQTVVHLFPMLTNWKGCTSRCCRGSCQLAFSLATFPVLLAAQLHRHQTLCSNLY